MAKASKVPSPRETFTDALTGREWHRPARLLTTDNAKTSKGEALGWTTAILYLAPSTLSGRNVCPMASAGCSAIDPVTGRMNCLFTAGRGSMENVAAGRMNKTLYLFNDRAGFLEQLSAELDRLERRALRKGHRIAVRLNGTSDLPWYKWLDLSRWSGLVFYDYTKVPARFGHDLPANYSLTFSRSEANELEALEVLRQGGNVAVVFAGDLPQAWHGFPLVQGDAHDLRFLDPRGGFVVGLTAKGDAKRDASGFVVRPSRALPVLQMAA